MWVKAIASSIFKCEKGKLLSFKKIENRLQVLSDTAAAMAIHLFPLCLFQSCGLDSLVIISAFPVLIILLRIPNSFFKFTPRTESVQLINNRTLQTSDCSFFCAFSSFPYNLNKPLKIADVSSLE